MSAHKHKQLLRAWEAVIQDLDGLPQLLQSLSSCPATRQQQLQHVDAIHAQLHEFAAHNKLPEPVLQKLVSAQVRILFAGH